MCILCVHHLFQCTHAPFLSMCIYVCIIYSHVHLCVHHLFHVHLCVHYLFPCSLCASMCALFIPMFSLCIYMQIILSNQNEFFVIGSSDVCRDNEDDVDWDHYSPFIPIYAHMHLNQPSFNWDSTNIIAEWKCFRDQVELLLVGGPSTGMEEPYASMCAPFIPMSIYLCTIYSHVYLFVHH